MITVGLVINHRYADQLVSHFDYEYVQLTTHQWPCVLPVPFATAFWKSGVFSQLLMRIMFLLQTPLELYGPRSRAATACEEETQVLLWLSC
jgi:hypothetical protein